MNTELDRAYKLLVIGAVINSLSCESDRRVQLHYECLLVALLHKGRADMSRIAKRFKITRQAVRYRVEKIRKSAFATGFEPIVIPNGMDLDRTIDAVDHLLRVEKSAFKEPKKYR